MRKTYRPRKTTLKFEKTTSENPQITIKNFLQSSTTAIKILPQTNEKFLNNSKSRGFLTEAMSANLKDVRASKEKYSSQRRWEIGDRAAQALLQNELADLHGYQRITQVTCKLYAIFKCNTL